MLEIIPTSAPVAAFRATGTMTGDDYDRIIAELERQLKAHEYVAVYAEVVELDNLSLPALLKDARYAFSKLGELERFARVAVVSDTPWLRAWAQYAWSLVPKASVRTFGSKEREAALAWANAIERVPVHRGLRFIPTSRPDTYAFAWDGAVTDEDVADVITKLETEFESHISVRVLARVERLGGIRPRALFRTTLARLKALSLRKVERYAIVSSTSWLGHYIELAGKVSGIEMRHFPREREAEAWAWLDAKPAGAQVSSSPANPDIRQQP